jgi:hypothetical protein
MRPHVELINEEDYVWHRADLPVGTGEVRERRLSVDEEDGSASLRVDFVSDFGRPAGVHHADAEYYVLEGELDVGGRLLGKGGYVHAGKGVLTPYLRAKAGTKVLHYREYGDAGFDEADADRPDAEEELIVLDTASMPWLDVEKPGPKPGLMIKMLHRNPLNGFYSRLIWAKPGWDDHRLAHHPCYEEAYTLGGTMEYNFGDLIEGTYFFRPARVKHGHFISGEPDGCFWLIRSDGDLINWYTINEAVIVEGEALNYDADKEGPVVSSMPVRSRRTGPWSGDGM